MSDFERLDEMTENRRIATRMMRWTDKQWREWYGIQADHIERMANRASPEVRHTLSWSLPWLRSVQNGGEDPVLPPRITKTRIPSAVNKPGLAVRDAIAPPPTRKRLSLKPKKKAPARRDLAAVVEEVA